MAQSKPNNLNLAYAAAAVSVLVAACGAAAALAGLIELSPSGRGLVVIAAIAFSGAVIAAVSAAAAAARAASRIPSYTAEVQDLRDHVRNIGTMLREREPDDEEQSPEAVKYRLAELSAVVTQTQTATQQTQEMLHHVMSKLDALRSVATTPSPAAAALDREADDADVFPVVDLNTPAGEAMADGFTRSPADPKPSEPVPAFVFRPTPLPQVDIEHFDSLDKARARVEDLMALSNWDQALAIATHYASTNPDDSDAQWLQQRVAREYEIYREGSVRRLYDQIKEELERKHYRRALSIARRLLDKFPEHKRAQKIRMQLPTILENAEIEERQEEETRIQSFIKSKRFADAVELGEALLAKYPLSPQASSLEELLPRLRELAIEQEADMLGRRSF